jgi:4-amino-4-deoxy-L-arabinose transferase-like glycosyltransferase
VSDPSLEPNIAKRWFVGALGLAAVVRFYLLWQYYCISWDGVYYIRAAEAFYRGDFFGGLQSVYPPGYPLLIAAIYPLTGDWELAGQMVSLSLGVGILFPLYWMFRSLFSEKVALLSCYLAAVSPFLTLYSAHVRSETPYLFFSALALYHFLTGIQRRSRGDFLWGGLIAGCAFLIRPEALGYLLIVPGVLVLRWLRQKKIGLAWSLWSMSLLVGGFLVFALPYIVYLSIDTGRFGAVSRKAGVTLGINLKESGILDEEDLARYGAAESLVFTDYIRQHPWRYGKKVALDLIPAVGVFFEALHYSYVPFLLLGLYLAFRDSFWDRHDLLLLGFVFAYVFGFALILVKRRYALQAVPISLAWVALGMWYFWDRLRASVPIAKATVIAGFVALVFVGATLPKTLKAVSREKAFVRETGRYLKALNKNGGLRVAALDDRVAFYAETGTIQLSGVEAARVRNYLREQRADYLAVEAKSLEKMFPQIFHNPTRFGLALEKTFIGTRKHRMLLFKVT